MSGWVWLRVRENWHKHPWISRLMCWLGRHDYEFVEMVNYRTARLSCFYCERKKHSAGARRDEWK